MGSYHLSTGEDLRGPISPKVRAKQLVPTYLDFIWSYFKRCDDAGQEVFDLLEVSVADAPGSVHQEDYISRSWGCAVELGVTWSR